MQNKHEEIIHFLMSATMGGPGVFSPNEYKKGKATREPADLAWFAGDVLLLAYGMKSEGSGRANFRERARHNLRQAKGFLRMWRGHGVRLRGSNQWREFDIVPGTMRIIVLSVVDSPDACCFYEAEWESELGVHLCASLPAFLLLRASQLGLGLVDIVRFLGVLRSYGLAMSRADGEAHIRNYVEQCWNRTRLQSMWPGGFDSPEYRQAVDHLNSTRMGQPEDPDAPEEIRATVDPSARPVDVLGDLGLETTAMLAHALVSAEKTWNRDRRTSWAVINGSYYKCFFAMEPHLNPEGASLKRVTEEFVKSMSGPQPLGPCLFYDPESKHRMMVWADKGSPSQSAVVIDAIRAKRVRVLGLSDV